MTLGVDTHTVAESLADASRVVTSLDEEATIQTVRSEALLPEEILEQNENARAVNLAVSALPERTQFIIRAVYFEERSVRSVADELGVSHSAISQKRAQGVRLLRESLIHHFGKVYAAPSALA